MAHFQTENFDIEGLVLIKPQVFGDHRGYFYESYNEVNFEDLGLPTHFVQDNQSLSNKGILRGLHFQKPPYEQGKLVRVVKGRALDVAVDVRKNSPTYGQHVKVELSEDNFHMFWIPPGFAHGFLTLEDQTIFCYKCTGLYNADSEDGLMWNDPKIAIDWPIKKEVVLSEKDRNYVPFEQFVTPF